MMETSTSLYVAWKRLKKQQPDGVILAEYRDGYIAFGDDAYAVARAVSDKPVGPKVAMRHAGDFTTARFGAADLGAVLDAIVASGGIAAVAKRFPAEHSGPGTA